LALAHIPIPAITIEHPVRLGHRTHRADIVVTHDQAPWLVVECKRIEDGDLPAALRQAQGYALVLGAAWAVATNGRAWLVTRQQGRGWELKEELPGWTPPRERISLDQLERAAAGVGPLQRWLSHPPSATDTSAFWAHLVHVFSPATGLWPATDDLMIASLSLWCEVVAAILDKTPITVWAPALNGALSSTLCCYTQTAPGLPPLVRQLPADQAIQASGGYLRDVVVATLRREAADPFLPILRMLADTFAALAHPTPPAVTQQHIATIISVLVQRSRIPLTSPALPPTYLEAATDGAAPA
ncbi:MAG TPA: type I restriction enzyme HsdR N-terminal domain-containing protein, partial [Herpetosiphonaceae bacterium]